MANATYEKEVSVEAPRGADVSHYMIRTALDGDGYRRILFQALPATGLMTSIDGAEWGLEQAKDLSILDR